MGTFIDAHFNDIRERVYQVRPVGLVMPDHARSNRVGILFSASIMRTNEDVPVGATYVESAGLKSHFQRFVRYFHRVASHARLLNILGLAHTSLRRFVSVVRFFIMLQADC